MQLLFIFSFSVQILKVIYMNILIYLCQEFMSQGH